MHEGKGRRSGRQGLVTEWVPQDSSDGTLCLADIYTWLLLSGAFWGVLWGHYLPFPNTRDLCSWFPVGYRHLHSGSPETWPQCNGFSFTLPSNQLVSPWLTCQILQMGVKCVHKDHVWGPLSSFEISSLACEGRNPTPKLIHALVGKLSMQTALPKGPLENGIYALYTYIYITHTRILIIF